jgi:hypothetical protein
MLAVSVSTAFQTNEWRHEQGSLTEREGLVQLTPLYELVQISYFLVFIVRKYVFII